MTLHIHNKRLYRIALLIILAISLAVLWQANKQVLSNPTYIPVDDFSHYWAAGRLALRGENPYDPEKIQGLRNMITGTITIYAEIPITWTPPWSLLLLMPYGTVPYPLARLLWLLTSIGIIMFSTDALWQIFSKGRKYLWVAWLMAFLFGPTISVLQKGQITPWILVGITGFLYFTRIKPNDWIAGAFTGLISLKPQLYYLFWPALIIWSLVNRRWIIVFSSALSILLASIPGLVINPVLIKQYIQAILHNTPTDWATPTIGGYLRLWLGTEKFYLQFLPILVGLGWFIGYWMKKRSNWAWINNLPILLFVSIITSAYAWTYDQVILLPAMISVQSKVLEIKDRKFTWFFFGLVLTVNLLDLLLHRTLNEFWFGWLAPAYLICFQVGNWITGKKQS